MGVARVYEGYAPYLAANVAAVDYAQTADAVYTAHIDYEPWRLTRAGHTDWTWSTLGFTPTIGAPTISGVVATQPNTTGAIATNYSYEVTAISADGEESRPSNVGTVSNDMSLQGNYNTVSWSAVTDAVGYDVYKGDNSSKGYIGSSTTTSFIDRNLDAIASDTPPQGTNPFAAVNDYPSAVALHQGRLWYARTHNRPNAVWGSQSANFENMDVSRPARPSDAVSFALVANQVNSVNQIASLGKNLVALTSDSIFAINGGGEGVPITPAAINPERQSARGSTRLKPIIVDNIMFYQPTKAGEVRTLGWDFQIEGLASNNVAIFSPHFFKNRLIVSWAYQDNPYSCIWAVLDNGEMLCFTWEQEHEVWGWTKIDIDGFVEQCASITEGGYARLYILVRRTIAGVERRFHERMALPHIDDADVACHLDCAITQAFDPPSNVVTGLWHLEGEEVTVHADGYSFHGLTVEDGSVTLPNGYEAVVATAGLSYEGLIETLPPVATGQGGTFHVDPQNIGQVTLRAVDTKGLEISTDGEFWAPLPERTGDDLATPADIAARDYEIPAPSTWQPGATLKIRQTEPFPAHLTAIFFELMVGGPSGD